MNVFNLKEGVYYQITNHLCNIMNSVFVKLNKSKCYIATILPKTKHVSLLSFLRNRYLQMINGVQLMLTFYCIIVIGILESFNQRSVKGLRFLRWHCNVKIWLITLQESIQGKLTHCYKTKTIPSVK